MLHIRYLNQLGDQLVYRGLTLAEVLFRRTSDTRAVDGVDSSCVCYFLGGGVMLVHYRVLSEERKRVTAMNRKVPKDIDEYLERHSNEDQRLLRQMRATIHNVAPEATEKISYGIPTFYLNGNLVHFAAFANHIGFYPTSSGIAAFKKQLGRYKWSKGAVQFPKAKPLPLALVTKIVKFRVKENLNK